MTKVLHFITGCHNTKKVIRSRLTGARFNPAVITKMQIIAVKPNGQHWRQPSPSAFGPGNYRAALDALEKAGWRIEYNGHIGRGTFLENPGVFLDGRFCPVYVNECKLVRATKES